MIVCGERRYKASMALQGLNRNTIPAVIRDISDDEALELQIIENLQRKDVHPMEEAVAFKSLLEHGKDLKDIAARIGKSEFYARQRMKLNALSENWQSAFFTHRITNTMALKIALFGESVQADLWKEVGQGSGTIDLTEWDFQKYRGDLANASFDLSDPTLNPKMGPCVNCKFNSATAALFPEAADNPKCSFVTCYKIKTDEHFKRASEEAILEPEMIFLHDSYGSSSDKDVAKLQKAGAEVHSRYNCEVVEQPEVPDWDQWREDNEDDYEVSAEELRNIFEKQEVEDYKKHLQSYETKVASGKYKKAFMVTGSERGKYVYVSLKKSSGSGHASGSAKKISPNEEVSAVDYDEEIKRLQDREKRNKELDLEKVHTSMVEAFKAIPEVTGTAHPLTSIDRVALIYFIVNVCGYGLRDKLKKIGVGDIDYGIKPEKAWEKLCAISDGQFGFIFRNAMLDKFGTSSASFTAGGMLNHMIKSYPNAKFEQLTADQEVVALKRQAKVNQRIEKLKKDKKAFILANAADTKTKKASTKK